MGKVLGACRAADGLPYEAVLRIMDPKSPIKEPSFVREFVFKKFYGYALFRGLNDWLKKLRFENRKCPQILISHEYPEFLTKNPNDNTLGFDEVKLCVTTAEKSNSDYGLITLWAKDHKLTCPFCTPKGKGRECFGNGSQHELMLGCLGFWISDNPTHLEGNGGNFSSFFYHDKETGESLTFCSDTIESLAVPLNVVHDNKLEVFMLMPKVCLETKQVYLWQYRLTDRFVLKEKFNGHCKICGSRDINTNPKINMGIYYLRYPETIIPKKGTKAGQKKRNEKAKYNKTLLDGSKKIVCNNCREYSLILEKESFEKLQVLFEEKGLCPNCYMPIEWSGKSDSVLQCSKCNFSIKPKPRYFANGIDTVFLSQVVNTVLR